ncbi:uncharacterized protein V2V93DRAFT_362245 [Kockiozyma suomiensis]|uniref:uncharacterized protein n=1 Tax=Kockiozyma suomiensis TaxID=1337062 RepID=UPI00334395F8
MAERNSLELPRSSAKHGPLNLTIALARATEYYPDYEIFAKSLSTMIELREVLARIGGAVPEIPREVHIVGSRSLYRQIRETVCSGHNVMMNGRYLFEGVRVVLDDRIQGLIMNNTGRAHSAGARLVDRLKTAIVANVNAAAQHDLQYRVYTGSPIVYSIKHPDGNEWIRPDQVIGIVDDMLSLSRPVWVAVALVGYSDSIERLRQSAQAFLIPPQDEEPERVDMVMLINIPYHREYETIEDIPEYVDINYYMRNAEGTAINKIFQSRVTRLEPTVAFDLVYMGVNDALEPVASEPDEPGRSIRMSADEEKFPGAWIIKHSVSPRVILDGALVASWLDDVFEERKVEARVYYEELRMAERTCSII